MRLKEDNDVSMRKASLLELNGVKKACNFPKNTILNVMNERVKLGMEDTCNQVRTLSSCLIRKQLILNFRPGRIG
jgi:hypothetical protein